MSGSLRATGIVVLLGVVGCNDRPTPPAPKPPTVSVATPVVETVAPYDDFTGSMEAIASVNVQARVKGFLEKTHFEPSTNVEKGQLLFEIDPAEYKAAVDKAKAEVEVREAERDLAETELKRSAALLEKRAASQEEVDQRRAARDQAVAMVAEAKAVLEKAQIDLDYCTIEAPISGRIARSLVDDGNLVEVNELLTNIVDVSRMYAYFDVSEPVVLEAMERSRKKGVRDIDDAEFPVLLGLANEEGYPHRGVIDAADNRLSTTTGTLQLRGVFSNEDRVFNPGLYCRIRIPKDPEKQVLVQETAVGTDLAGKYLYVIGKDDIVERRAVSLGATYGDRVAVDEGIQPDERYIVRGVQLARPGKPVNPETAESGDEDQATVSGSEPSPEPSPERAADGKAGPDTPSATEENPS